MTGLPSRQWTREVCPVARVEDQLREVLLVQCRADRIEPPGRIDRIIASARAEKAFCPRTVERLGEVWASRLPIEAHFGPLAGAEPATIRSQHQRLTAQ
ncbi:hypothetical protein [Kitasatospora sp. NPDC048407]|uniref:hypothetical protein n=1 Tax=Kitasatospora sp. NPDC048407 TaxID=3364051 RepID=UPI0037174224